MAAPRPKRQQTTTGARTRKRSSGGTVNEIENQARQASTVSRAENEVRRQAKRGQQH